MVLTLAAGGQAHGENAPAGDTLASFQHTAFSRMAGGPSDISDVIQDSDGFLWLAVSKGVVRFDGVNFRPFVPLPGEAFQQAQVTRLHPAEGGGFWMDSDSTGPTLVHDGHLTVYGAAQGFQGVQQRFYTGPDGHVRALSPVGINEFANGRWRLTAGPWKRGDAVAAVLDDAGVEWLATRDGLKARAGPEAPLVRTDGPSETLRRVVSGHSGRLYVQTEEEVHIYQRVGTRLTELAKPIQNKNVHGILETRAGALWLTTTGAVLYVSKEALALAEKTRSAPVAETFDRSEGLSGSFAWPVIEDHAGNVWVGTDAGLDLFQKTTFAGVKLPAGIHELSAASDLRGNVWLASENKPLLMARPQQPWAAIGEQQLTLALARDAAHDVVWAVNAAGLWRLTDESQSNVAPPPFPLSAGPVNCMTTDSRGWVYACSPCCTTPGRVWNGHEWHDLPALPHPPKVAVVDGADVLWFGISGQPMLARVAGDKATFLDDKNGLATGPVKALLPVKNGLWVGGDKGVQYFDGTHFLPLPSGAGRPLEWVTGLVEDKAGHLWIQTLDGVMRSREANVGSSLRNRTLPVTFDYFGLRDGVEGAPDPERTLPTLRMGGDGKIWAQAISSLSWTDPAHLLPAAVPPRPRIDAVSTAKGSQVAGAEVINLASDEREVRIGYTTAALVRPDLVHFSYRLVGMSGKWEDVGARREATFTNLPPGDFIFQVRAFNQDGESQGTTSLRLIRQPAFVETWLFRILLLVPVVLVLWLFYLMRTRALARKLRIRAEEREAVARDIHDTLLQRFQGVMLTMQGWSGNAAIPARERKEIQEVCQETREAILEGRERIIALRGVQHDDLGLYNELMMEGRRLADEKGMAFAVKVSGEARALRKEAQRELRDIAVEALRNAFGHSGGSRVELTLSYEPDVFWVVVTDDGQGVDEVARAHAPKRGHFGMVGMRERAGHLRGSLRVDSVPGEGTEVHVSIPARAAYSRD
jgi:signal transduction histidine kinase/ligand-binding sensor domain-containing protein